MVSAPGKGLLPFIRGLATISESCAATDGQLLEGFLRHGQETAFRALVDRHGPMVMGVCRRVLQNPHDAEDAFQATFLVLVRKASSIIPREQVANWLFGVAHRTAQKARVARARKIALTERVHERNDVMPSVAPPTDDKNWRDLQPVLDEELQRLPDKYRAAIVLCDLEGKSRKVAARQLGWPEGTLSGRLARGRKRLAAALSRRGITLSVAGLASLIGKNAVTAVVPAALKSNLIHAALLTLTGKAVPVGVVCAHVATLTNGVIKTMLVSKLKACVAILATVGMLASGVGLAVHPIASANSHDQTAPLEFTADEPNAGNATRKQLQIADAEMHVVGVYGPKKENQKVIEVEVRPQSKPIVLVLTAYEETHWQIKRLEGARIKHVIVSGYFAQHVKGLPADVEVTNKSYFAADGSTRKGSWFWSHQWNTPQWREMMLRLNEITGLPASTYQAKYQGTSFVVDGKLGSELGQSAINPREVFKQPTLDELFAAVKDAEMHAVGMYSPDRRQPGKPVGVEVRPTDKPIILVLTSYYDAVWNVKLATGSRVNGVIVGAYMPQEIEGLPAGVPVYRCYPDPAKSCFESSPDYRRPDTFYAYRPNTIEFRKMADRLYDLTGLLVSSFQAKETGDSFVVDGTTGREHGQAERKVQMVRPKELTPAELLTAAVDADLHVVGIYQAADGNGAPVDIEVRPTQRPMILALTSYSSILWRVKLAEGARVKAVIVAGYFEQELEGVPANIPVIERTYFPKMNRDHFYAYKPDTPEFANAEKRLKEMTGREVTTFQCEYSARSLVVDGVRNGESKKANDNEDAAADVADVRSQDLRAAGDKDQRYFLIGPKQDAKPQADGYGLVVIMPGGDGSADFQPFVKRIYKNAIPDKYLVAQPVAVKWSPDQQIVWPTSSNKVDKMKFSTEEIVKAVIDDVAKKQKLDRKSIYTLSWSSSGPAAYATSLQEGSAIKGSLIAMSVFNPKYLPPLAAAKGHAYYLYHSKEDRICPYRMAEQAKENLTAQGAKVHLETYDGGHGWHGDLYNDIRAGVEWLERNK